MATLTHSDTRRLYSWWWDSHNSPKNSKWLQDNLTDMDAKVKAMIKLIEEDADSFARRAEMYYEKRPELMKLVEEFYRAYRALAERYNHATGELRHAHRTIAKVFPDQAPPEFVVNDSPSKPSYRDPHTPERKLPVRVLFGTDDSLNDAPHKDDDVGVTQSSKSAERGIRKGLEDKKENKENFCDEALELSNESQHLTAKVVEENERAGKTESEIQDLKRAVSDMQAEKENVLLKYQQCLAKLSDIEGELNSAQNDSRKFNEKASRAEIEVHTLKEALVQLEAEKNAGIIKHTEYSEKIFNLEATVSRIQEDNNGLNIRAIEAETEAQTLKDEILRLEQEKETVLQQYKQCLERISALENLISMIEDEVSLLKKQAERAENNVSELRKSLLDLNKEKEASAIQYKCCLETISKLERDISSAKEEVGRLNSDVLIGNRKLKTAEEKCTVLEMSNQSLETEAENLVKKIAVRDRELSEKLEELENLQTYLHNEQLRHSEIEATLKSLQNLHYRSQDDQRALVSELQNVLCMQKDMELSKHCLEEEILKVREENHDLRDMHLSSSSSMEDMQKEILTLREIKERLEREVSRHIDLSNCLQNEILRLKEEIEGLKSLQDENLNLREMNEEGSNDREILSNKLENLQELFNKKVVSESLLSDLSRELQSSREKVKAVQESCEFLQGENASLVAEKASLLAQLEMVTANMEKLLEKNAVLENSLSSEKVELEGLRKKSKGLEQICELLKNEQKNLLAERNTLALKLENIEKKLEKLEKQCTGLEEKCAGLGKEKEAMHSQVEELKFSLGVEKQERTNSKWQSEMRLAGLENQILFLKEENNWKKKEFEEELERSLKTQFELSIMQKFMKDVEEKNHSLIIECQKHVDASKLAENLISELENESLQQQVEAELLLEEIERLRLSIYQVFRALETGTDDDSKEKIENELTFLHHILGGIGDMKHLISEHEDANQLLMVENSVLLTLLEQLEFKATEIESKKTHLEEEFRNMAERLSMSKNEKDKLVEMNRKLKSEASESHHHAALLEAELEILRRKQVDLLKSYAALEEDHVKVNRDNSDLLKKFTVLKDEKYLADEHNDAALLEYLATDNQSVVLSCSRKEKVAELKLFLEDLNRQSRVNRSLENETCMLTEKLELQKAENSVLKDSVSTLEGEMQGMREYNVLLTKDTVSIKEMLLQTERELFNTETKLEAADNLNLMLSRTVDELKKNIQESTHTEENLENDILELSEINSIQKKEIESLHIIKRNFETETAQLRKEMEETKVREQSLSSKLQEKNKELELGEAEAMTFYFDVQIFSIHDIFYRNKVQELTRACLTLENENDLRTSEMEQMKGKICSMESEISRLKSRLCAYAPIIAALRDEVMFLEQNALRMKREASRSQELEFTEVTADPSESASETLDDQSLVSLQNLQIRIKAVGKSMEVMKKPMLHRRSSSKSMQESATGEIERSKSHGCLGREQSRKKGHGNEDSETPKLQRIRTKASDPRNAVLMKDIPLDRVSNSSRKGTRKKFISGDDDQMLELWEDGGRDPTIAESLRMSYRMNDKDIVLYDGFESVKRTPEPPSTDSDMEKELAVDKWEVSRRSNEQLNSRRVLERLDSDALKLKSLRETVQNLRSKLETTNKKVRKAKNVDLETIEEQLLEAEETVINLTELNGRLVKNMEQCHSPDRKGSPQTKEVIKRRRRKATEQVRKGSERIGRLQLELQKIQYILLKMEEEKKNKARNKFLKRKTFVLRDYIVNGRRNSMRSKKGQVCGCFRPSTSRSGTSP